MPAQPFRGSSPLARGLLQPRWRRRYRPGIIPARAGFTQPRPLPVRPGPDHPRSRGVYAPNRRTDRDHGGSSPLARGLRGQHPRPAGGQRIIPARAGFTRQGSPGRCRIQDHPRSRGVYATRTERNTVPRGSSPLARGLLPSGWIAAHRSGIIPARAGFTPTRGAVRGRTADHPRSRGVYDAVEGGPALVLGSSPLARGLLGRRHAVERLEGIIPARAGFTRLLDPVPPPHRDHPRSRGVYHPSGPGGSQVAGSSPLARGLLV